MTASRDWWADAACKGQTDIFFPEPVNSRRTWSNSQYEREYAPARKVCRGCPVLGDCLAYALSLPRVHVQGMLAGLRPGEIYELRKRLRRDAA